MAHEGRGGHWLEGRISTTSIGQREQVQGGVMEKLGISFLITCFFCRRGEWMCERRTSCYVWKCVVHGNKWCVKKEHGRKLCVTNSHSSWNDFHE